MSNYCPSCGARVVDPESTVCDFCGETLQGGKQAGFLSRLAGWLFGTGNEPLGRHRREVRVCRSETFQWTDPATGQQRTSTSIDDLPPELRAQVEAARQRAASEGVSSGSRYTFRDPSGQEHTYNSLEEMPEDIRRLFERARKR